MGDSLNYLIDVPGRQFNSLLAPEARLSEAEIERVLRNDELGARDAWFSDLDSDFGADVTGAAWTICTLPFNYSLLSRAALDDPRRGQNATWERYVRCRLTSSRII